MDQPEKLVRDLLRASGAAGRVIVRERIMRCLVSYDDAFPGLGLTLDQLAKRTGIPFAITTENVHALQASGEIVDAPGCGRYSFNSRKDRS